jgi:P-type Cu+ transporter
VPVGGRSPRRGCRSSGLAPAVVAVGVAAGEIPADGELDRRLVVPKPHSLSLAQRHVRFLDRSPISVQGHRHPGDTLSAAAAARAAGIGTVRAGLLPDDKAILIERLRRDRGPVAMVGDGINDAPALAGADIGIAVATGTGAAMAAADITLVHGGVGAVADAVLLARATRKIIRQNLTWAFGHNLILCRWPPPACCRPCSPPPR